MLNVIPMANGEAVSRHHIERYIEQLIDLLDAMDGDSDLEPDNAGMIGWWDNAEGDDADSESSFGWTASIAQVGVGWTGEYDPHGLDREHDDEREHDDAEFGIADQDGLAEQFGGLVMIGGVQ